MEKGKECWKREVEVGPNLASDTGVGGDWQTDEVTKVSSENKTFDGVKLKAEGIEMGRRDGRRRRGIKGKRGTWK